MARFKQGLDVDQGLLLPPSLRDRLQEDHFAWFIMDAVDSLDIGVLLKSYRASGKGELPYEPWMMLRVLIYAYATGTFSSRRIENQLHDSVAFRVLAGNQAPSLRSISRFRVHHIEHFSQLFAQVVKAAAESGMVKIGTLAIDGSKPKANASKHKAMSYARMKEEEARLEREIAAIMNLAQDQDADDDVKFGPDFRGDELPEELRRRETRLQKIGGARARLEKRKAEEAAAADEAKKAKAEEEGREHPKERLYLPVHAEGALVEELDAIHAQVRAARVRMSRIDLDHLSALAQDRKVGSQIGGGAVAGGDGDAPDEGGPGWRSDGEWARIVKADGGD